ncbi:MAG: hypothetical protein NZ703_08155 [Gemmataceae bacterium]|nr:hypothetical protein [Gemmataceae bacterium]MDW8241982.1 hypothetical protein [Thermogemmata sp.]
MKNFIILTLTALLLFAVSAALSLWLQQSALPAPAVQNDKEKVIRKNGGKSEEEGTRPPPTKGESSLSTPSGTAASDMAAALTALREREAQLERRLQQVQIVLRDLQEERERFDALVRQLGNEIKSVTKRLEQLSALEAEAGRKRQEPDENDRKNVDRLAAMFDSMEGEAAASVIKQMADSGRMELAARILAQMKERNAARILTEMNDPALATQLVERVRAIKFPGSSAATGSGLPSAGANVPAGGPTGLTPAGGVVPP